MGRRLAVAVLALLISCPLALMSALAAAGPILAQAPSAGTAAIRGVATDEKGPVSGATVRVQATRQETRTDERGRFTLEGLPQGVAVVVSAWKDGYYCARAQNVVPPESDLVLRLHLYQTNDNPSYQWIAPLGDNSCVNCHGPMTGVWLENDAHAGAARNPVFLTMYNGTDTKGKQSPATRFAKPRDYGAVPLRPDPSQPYYGPGYRLDFPDTTGNCAACHTPGAALGAPYDTDPTTVTGADTFGVHCDFCHKVAGVKLNPADGLPYPNMPGVLSMDIRRPFLDDKERPQLFFGTFDDVNAAEGDTNLPLLRDSRFCAPCHFGVFWNTVIYNSYGEWLASPYSDPVKGKSCQDCHTPAPTMVGGVAMTNVAPDKGGVERDPSTLHAHTFPGSRSETLLKESLTMKASAGQDGDSIAVSVEITNDRTGHHVPTDSPLRNMILLVQARDSEGKLLSQVAGSTVPQWGGVGDAGKGYYAGLPGKGFAKVLEELWTEVAPTGAYWNHTRVRSDNRIAAFATDVSDYAFEMPRGGGDVDVEVKLLFRRAFRELADQKGWDIPDVVMAEEALRVPAGSK